MKLLTCLLIAGLAAFWSLPVQAEEKEAKKEDKKSYALEDVVVTAMKIPQKEEKITQKIDVITAEQAERIIQGNRNVAEIFQYQPGTFASVLSRNDANWGSYGGLGPKYNGYLLDGLGIDSFVDTMSLDPMAFERAEVHRGPAAVMYSNYLSQDFAGTQSPLAGITNLVLRDLIDQPLTRIALGYGSWNTYQGRAYHQGKAGNFHYFLGANYEKSDYTNYGTANSWLNMIDNPEYQKTRLYFKTTYRFDRDDHRVSLFAHHTQHTGDVGRPNRDYDHNYDTINAAYNNQINDWLNTQFKAGYRSYDRRWGEDNYPASLALREHDGVKQQIIPLDLTFNLKHWKDSLLTFGADYQQATYETYAEANGLKTKGNDSKAAATGIYVQENLVWDKWVFRLGGRYSYSQNNYDLISGAVPQDKEKTYDKFLYSTGVRFNSLSMLSAYANVGSSFQSPSAKSVGGTLLASDRGVAGKNGQLPNTNLKPESGIGSDLGLDIRPIKNMVIGIRGFYNEVDDAIVENRVSENPSQSQSVNAGKTKSYGVELEIKHRFEKYAEWFANYTYTKTDITNDVDKDQNGANVPFVPDYMANVGVTAFLPWDITVSPYLRLVGEYFDSTSSSGRKSFGPYEILNVKITKGLWKTANHQALLNIDLVNLTDKKYEMPWQFQDPGFSVFGSLELQF
jgi:outer membrane receptor protein involved in Fe transport